MSRKKAQRVDWGMSGMGIFFATDETRIFQSYPQITPKAADWE
ncbi:MAG: hypothetical protein ACLP2Y_13465 [Limisphaerales bacterium]